MSKKRIRTYCLIIDASVAKAAGTQHQIAHLCSDFLNSVRSICHRMAWTERIKAEWDKHRSPFAAQWLVSMMQLRKLQSVKDQPLDELRNAIESHSSDPNVSPIMLKDAHLLEAALASDRRVASLDDNARGHFSRLASSLDLIRKMTWVNPAIADENAVQWLEAGAKIERSRWLIRYGR
jgi:hypothetical protein